MLLLLIFISLLWYPLAILLWIKLRLSYGTAIGSLRRVSLLSFSSIHVTLDKINNLPQPNNLVPFPIRRGCKNSKLHSIVLDMIYRQLIQIPFQYAFNYNSKFKYFGSWPTCCCYWWKMTTSCDVFSLCKCEIFDWFKDQPMSYKWQMTINHYRQRLKKVSLRVTNKQMFVFRYSRLIVHWDVLNFIATSQSRNADPWAFWGKKPPLSNLVLRFIFYYFLHVSRHRIHHASCFWRAIHSYFTFSKED